MFFGLDLGRIRWSLGPVLGLQSTVSTHSRLRAGSHVDMGFVVTPYPYHDGDDSVSLKFFHLVPGPWEPIVQRILDDRPRRVLVVGFMEVYKDNVNLQLLGHPVGESEGRYV